MNEVPHMSSDEFRRHGREVVDYIADYMERVGDFPVLSRSRPGEILKQLPESPPEAGEPWSLIMADVERIVIPGLTHWQSPRFFAYFPANSSFPAILADMLSTGFAVQGMLWQTSPACTEIEQRMLDWLAQLIALPERFRFSYENGGGVIQGTASDAVLVAMLAGRHRAQTSQGRGEGRLMAYTSNQAHSSLIKGAMIAGLGHDAVRLIDVDDHLAMRPEALRQAIEQDRADGHLPFFVCATLGTTSTGAVDPLRPIGEIARQHQLWLHVDAAYAGSALVCPEHRWMIDGVDLADSFNFNPHKWLLTNFDCSALWTSDRQALTGAMSITPEYLRNEASDAGGIVDYRDWQVPLGRRFRALKLWFVMRHYGISGLQAHIRHHIRLAELLEQLIREDDRFELVMPRSLGLVCFRLKSGDEATRMLQEAINRSGRVFLTHTVVPRRHERLFALRMAIGGPGTTESDLRAAWECISGAHCSG